MIVSLEVSDLARLLAIHILNCRGRKLGACTESIETLAAKYGHTERTVRRALRELTDAGVLVTRRRRRGTARRSIRLPLEDSDA